MMFYWLGRANKAENNRNAGLLGDRSPSHGRGRGFGRVQSSANRKGPISQGATNIRLLTRPKLRTKNKQFQSSPPTRRP